MKNYLIAFTIFLCSSFLLSAPGDLIWRYQTGNVIVSSPCTSNGVDYVGSYDSYIYAINAFNGTLGWSYLTGGAILSSPCILDGVVYFGSNDNYLYAINASNGALKWRYLTGSAINYSSPCISNEVVYIGSNDTYLYAINASNGALKWRYKTGGLVYSSPSIADDVIYIGSYDYYLYAINASDGNLKWRYQTGYYVRSSPCVSEGVVYVGSWDNYLYAIRTSDGSLRWRYQTGSYVEATPCIIDGVVYVGSRDSYLYAINASDGSLKWRYKTGVDIESSPSVLEGIIYIGSDDNYLYSVNSSDGTLKWRYQTGNDVYSSPCVVDGVVCVGSGDYYLYALQAGTIQVVTPNGGENWYCNDNNNITWNATAMDSVNLFYSTDAGANWVSIATCADPSSGNGTYDWKIPWMSNTTQARVRATNYIGNLSDNSDANFTISPGTLSVDVPNGGEVWYVGENRSIVWTATTNLDSVIIEYSTDNGSSYTEITKQASSPNNYTWTIPNTPSTQCIVRVSNAQFSEPSDASNAVFEIRRTGFEKATYKNSIPLKFNVSPNPFSDRLILSIPSSTIIYDITGRMITRLDKGKYTLDTSKWREGVYIVKSGTECKRVVKIR